MKASPPSTPKPRAPASGDWIMPSRSSRGGETAARTPSTYTVNPEPPPGIVESVIMCQRPSSRSTCPGVSRGLLFIHAPSLSM